MHAVKISVNTRVGLNGLVWRKMIEFCELHPETEDCVKYDPKGDCKARYDKYRSLDWHMRLLEHLKPSLGSVGLNIDAVNSFKDITIRVYDEHHDLRAVLCIRMFNILIGGPSVKIRVKDNNFASLVPDYLNEKGESIKPYRRLTRKQQ